MALIFEYEKDINTGTQPFMSHEEDSTIYNYFISEEKALDRSAFAENGYYDDITFDNEERHLTTKAVSKIGVKNFPGIGGIGFFKDAYTEDSRIVAPIHSTQQRYEAPILEKAEIVDNKLHIVITPPTDLKYTCYRVIARQQYFAFEYITYKNDYCVDIPTVKGDYTVYCIGYDEDNGTVSEDSNELALTVPDGDDDWAPHFQEVGDLIVQIGATSDKVAAMEADIDAIGDNVLLLHDNQSDLEGRVTTLEETVNGVEELVDEINGEVV